MTSARAPRPTLETVAARAGVSRSLVSLVLRESPRVSAASREAVLKAVAEVGYRPNAAARRLVERQSRMVGVLLNDIRQPWFADMLDGLTPALYAGGKHMLLGDGAIDRTLGDTLTWSFLDMGVDGLVLAGSFPAASEAVMDVARRVPTVAVGGLDFDLPARRRAGQRQPARRGARGAAPDRARAHPHRPHRGHPGPRRRRPAGGLRGRHARGGAGRARSRSKAATCPRRAASARPCGC